jgi:hypothetical protein
VLGPYSLLTHHSLFSPLTDLVIPLPFVGIVLTLSSQTRAHS